MADSPPTTEQHQPRAAIQPISSTSFISSPLKPTSPTHASNPFARSVSRPASRTSTHLSKLATYDPTQGAPLASSAGPGSRGSMILYRLADDRDRPSSNIITSACSDNDIVLVPPEFPSRRDSNSGDSIVSDSKYPSGVPDLYKGGLIAYPYDPTQDELDTSDDEDFLHDPGRKGGLHSDKAAFPWRGVLNVSLLTFLLLCLLTLFIFYPVMSFYKNRGKNAQITGNIPVTCTSPSLLSLPVFTGQAPALPNIPQLIDADTPQGTLSRTGFDGNDYTFAFPNEQTRPGRTFYPGNDPNREAVNIWYGATGDIEWYNPRQVTTRDGAPVITMDSTGTLQDGLPSSMFHLFFIFVFLILFFKPSRKSGAGNLRPSHVGRREIFRAQLRRIYYLLLQITRFVGG